jgi:flagellar hook-length control protein FliK
VRGELAESRPAKRKPKSKVDAKASEVASLQEENARLTRKLAQAELIIDAQKKLTLALEQTLSEPKDKS